jgi:hypothetical protein
VRGGAKQASFVQVFASSLFLFIVIKGQTVKDSPEGMPTGLSIAGMPACTG